MDNPYPLSPPLPSSIHINCPHPSHHSFSPFSSFSATKVISPILSSTAPSPSLPKSGAPMPSPFSHPQFIFLNAAAHPQKHRHPPTPPLTPHMPQELPAKSYEES